MKVFGKSKEEQTIEEKAKAREICQVILDYGVNQNQIKQLIYLLAIELEDNNLMKKITNVIKNNTEDESSKIITGEEK